MKNYLIILLLLTLASCKKDEEEAPKADDYLTLNLSFRVGVNVLQFDTLLYTNAAGNEYSVSRLQFYLSNIQLIRTDSSLVDISDYSYVDAREPSTLKISNKIPDTGDFIGMKMQVGLDSIHNITNALPATIENINMEWPVPMGGGYHFMKFEGKYRDGLDEPGYAMHLGKNPYLVQAVTWKTFNLSAGNNAMNLVMDLNEWYDHPQVYDFNVDGNYSMGVGAAMTKLSQNGTDIFTLQ
ncbi:MAG: hypothetical protein JNL88_09605 [Bacteroidia bacterium]|nr:hypothetical protein [Bacteroidia bacterium]